MMNIVSLRFDFFNENTYLIFDETRECLIVDPGCYTQEERNELIHLIECYDLTPVKIVNTHCHLDHVIGNSFLTDRYDIPMALPEGEVRFFESMPEFAKKFNFDIKPCPGEYECLSEGKLVCFGNSAIQVLSTPGHSPDGISLLNKEEKVLISGDTLFLNKIGRVDLPGGNYDRLITSIKEKIFSQKDDIVVYPGHGPTTTIGYEKKSNTLRCWT